MSLTGVVAVRLVWDARWSSFRVIFQAQIVSLLAIAGSLLAGSAALHPDRIATPLFIGLIVGALSLYLAVYIVMERRVR
ncbi:hypothetical protein [Microbacterium schleiferi]|uniref:hypothetical protein n=1 Tax=Microbacterium schleiferi TaxID=69362 RepID=UPI0035C7AB6F|tara:strand:- start:21 stop:257 length:237 start_codon:yes stop_codon:yes gene_type:complete